MNLDLPAREKLVVSLLPSYTISKNFIKEIILEWWLALPSGRQTFLKQKNELCAKTGTVLRFDHSYKFVKCIGVTEEAQWV